MKKGTGENVGILLPTYNEAGNIKNLIYKIREILPSATVIVVDDNSPDFTWKIVEELQKTDINLKLIRRFNNRGRGSAGIKGFIELLKIKKLDKFLEMDCDFSHNPIFIPSLINGLSKYDMVLGSRYIYGGKDIERTFLRQLISKFANFYSRKILGLKVLDTTSGFRSFTRKTLESIHINSLNSRGPSIVSEILYKVSKHSLKIGEVPIIFEERHEGKSQLSFKILIVGFFYILKLRLEDI